MSVSDEDLARLMRMQQLRESGAITDEEFETMKQSVLNPADRSEESPDEPVAATSPDEPVAATGVEVISDMLWKLPVDVHTAHRQIAAAAPRVGLEFGQLRDVDGTSGFEFRGKAMRHKMSSLFVWLAPNGPGTNLSFAVPEGTGIPSSSAKRKLFEDVQKPLLEALRRAN